MYNFWKFFPRQNSRNLYILPYTKTKQNNNNFFFFFTAIKFCEKPLFVGEKHLNKKKKKKKPLDEEQEENLKELINDPSQSNPVENKMWALDDGNIFLDAEIKPSPSDKIRLESILKIPPNQSLKEDEKQLCWKYQKFLSKRPEALSKFLHSVNWNNENQSFQFYFILFFFCYLYFYFFFV